MHADEAVASVITFVVILKCSLRFCLPVTELEESLILSKTLFSKGIQRPLFQYSRYTKSISTA